MEPITFGRWTVISVVDQPGPKLYECRCACGKVKIVRRSNLVSGKSTGCQECHLLRARSHAHRPKPIDREAILSRLKIKAMSLTKSD
jgi:hypothetical protein